MFLPSRRVPIHPPEKLRDQAQTTSFILPWNLHKEIAAQLQYTREWVRGSSRRSRGSKSSDLRHR